MAKAKAYGYGYGYGLWLWLWLMTMTMTMTYGYGYGLWLRLVFWMMVFSVIIKEDKFIIAKAITNSVREELIKTHKKA